MITQGDSDHAKFPFGMNFPTATLCAMMLHCTSRLNSETPSVSRFALRLIQGDP